MADVVVPEHLPLSRRSVSWKVNSEPLVFAGGGRALLMQVAHPGVGAGVEQHSSYAKDPWGRLFRTVDIMMKLSFGSPEVSARQARILEKMHRRVQGTTDLGGRYSALDTDLQLWVWATLVDTALRIHERVRGPLPAGELEQFYAESKLVAHGCGVPVGACPETWADFERYVDRVVATELVVTRSARSVAVASMSPPVPGPVGPLMGVPIRLVTVGLMAPSLREQFGFEWTRSHQRRLDAFFALARAGTAVTPAPLRRLGAVTAINQKHAPRIPWLQRRGAELTAERLEAAGLGS